MFTDSSNAIGSTIVSWFWDFGDGVTDTTQNPTHIYTNDGTYNACLIITTSDQCMDTICDTVVINCLNSIDATLGEQLGVKVFPNPADDVAHVSFELPNAMEVSWELTAIDGRILYNDNVGLLTAGNGKFTVPVDQLPAGLYFIRIQFGEGSVVQKVMTD